MGYNEGRHLAVVQEVGSHSVGGEESEWTEMRCSRRPADVALPGDRIRSFARQTHRLLSHFAKETFRGTYLEGHER